MCAIERTVKRVGIANSLELPIAAARRGSDCRAGEGQSESGLSVYVDRNSNMMMMMMKNWAGINPRRKFRLSFSQW